MATNKTITMHPLNSDGNMIDPTVNLYPKTLATNVLDTDNVNPYPFQKAITVNDPHNYLQKQGDATLTFNVNAFMKQIIETLYPVGSIYCSYDATLTDPNNALDPGNLYGLTMDWAPIEGRMLMAAGTTSGTSNIYTTTNTGGNASVTLSEDHIPSHHHHVSQTITRPAYSYTFRGGMGSGGNIDSNAYFCGVSTSTSGSTSDTSANSDYVSISLSEKGRWTMGSEGTQSGIDRYNTVIITHKAVDINVDADTSNYGNGNSFSILPPYVVVKMWRRRA